MSDIKHKFFDIYDSCGDDTEKKYMLEKKDIIYRYLSELVKFEEDPDLRDMISKMEFTTNLAYKDILESFGNDSRCMSRLDKAKELLLNTDKGWKTAVYVSERNKSSYKKVSLHDFIDSNLVLISLMCNPRKRSHIQWIFYIMMKNSPFITNDNIIESLYLFARDYYDDMLIL